MFTHILGYEFGLTKIIIPQNSSRRNKKGRDDCRGFFGSIKNQQGLVKIM
jgi:hypothetical protein